jgi:RNA polymerase sigma factor (sigma-70 family)
MRGLARHHGAGPDSEDAWQRALEIAVGRASELDPEWIERWLRVVVRNEARRIVRGRRRVLLEEDLERADDAGATEDERLELVELRERARRDVPRLKPQERRALGLLAAGLSYREISARTGWTHTKVNRCVSEGRAALRRMAAA